MVYFVGLLSSSCTSCAYSPYRLVCNDNTLELFGAYAAKRYLCLHCHNFVCDALLALLKIFANAEYYLESFVKSCACALLDRYVRIAEICAALAVACDDVFYTHSLEHWSRNLTGKSSALFPVYILSAYFYI